MAPAPISPDWGGSHGGVQLEYGNATASDPAGSDDFDGGLFGVFGGYRADYGNMVFGTEFDFVAGELSSDTTGVSIDNVMRATLELGYEVGRNALVYGTGGVFGAQLGGVGFDDTDWGYVAGLGVDYRVTDNSFLSAELLYHSIDDFSDSGTEVDATTFGVGYAFEF